MSAHTGVRKKKRKKKQSVDTNPRSPSSTLQKVESSSHRLAGSVGSTQSLNAKSKRRKKVKKRVDPQHSRYATAHTNQYEARHKRKPKKRNKPKNKIKARNKAAHRKAATTANTLNPNKRSNHKKKSHHSSATSPNALNKASSSPSSSKYRTRSSSRASNPRSFRHKFEMSEMKLVIGQIGDMKKSWKSPAATAMGKIYEMVYMEERPHLNGKYCKVMLILDDDNYRVALLGNASEHVVARENLKVAFETENLYLLWESQTSQKGGTKSSKRGTERDSVPMPPSALPPHQDPDDMFTIQQFEHSFNDTYEFKRLDFYCMGFCILLGVILSACGAFLYTQNDANNDLHAMGAFTVIFAPILGILCGAYIGCLWYCCAVSKGKMEYYLGNNRFFGLKCAMFDCCKYQYFIVVAFIGILIVLISAASFLLFDKFVYVDDMKTDTNNTNPLETDANGDISINEKKLFIAVEVLCACGGIGLCISGIMAYHCCSNRYAEETRNRESQEDIEMQKHYQS